jgi:hypothetical protein
MIKNMKAFLWTGNDVINGSKCLVAWSRVQRLWWPSDQGPKALWSCTARVVALALEDRARARLDGVASFIRQRDLGFLQCINLTDLG